MSEPNGNSEQLTRKQVLEMEPGKELDWHIARWMGVDEQLFNWGYEAGNHNYSTDISAAWKVIEKIKEKVDTISFCWTHDSWACHLTLFIPATDDDPFGCDFKEWLYDSPSAPEAICKAALLAVMDL